jgi:hypothetical protein
MAGAHISGTGKPRQSAAKPRRDVGRVRAAFGRTPRRPGTRRLGPHRSSTSMGTLRSLLMTATRSHRCSRAAWPEAKDGCWAV